MEGRCAVETWSQFGFSAAPSSSKVQIGFGTDVFMCCGNDEVYVFCSKDKKLTAVLQLPGPVCDLAQSPDEQLLYVACSDGVYCVNMQCLQHRSPSPSAEASTGPAELKVSSEFLVVGADGVSSLLLVGSVLLTLSQRDMSWLLTAYKTPKQTQPGSYQTLGSFSLPLVAAPVYADRESGSRTVLICIHCGDATPTSSPEATSLHPHFRLEPVLFKLLFGVEAALANSAVILCGLPDGRLGFLPLRLPGSRLRVLHSLEQPLVCVAASLVAETGSGHAQCLVALGERGRLVLIKADKGRAEGEGSTLCFTQAYVPGPVACGCVGRNRLYWSTGSDLLALDLSKGSLTGERREKDEETSSSTAAALQSPTSLNVCRVVALTEPKHSAAGEVELLGLSARGRLLRISLPVRGGDAGLSTLPPPQVGRRVQDLLSAIGDVFERASAIKTAIKSKNLILQRLNQAVNISFLLTAMTEEHLPLEERPVRCHARTSWSRLLQRDSLTLTCVLENSSPYVLDGGWTLSVTVCPLCLPVSAGGQSPSTNFSFPLHRLPPAETLQVSLPLADAGDMSSFPVTVNFSLVFSLSGLLGDEEEEEEEEEAAGVCGCVSVPLNTLTVDWLHVLQVEQSNPARTASTTQSSTIADPISDFLNSRRVRSGARRSDRGGESACKPETYSACVRVSAEFVKDTLMPKSSSLHTKEQKLDSPSLSVSLLDWLLCGGDGGVKAGREGEKSDLSSSVVHARGPNAAAVKLAAKEVNAGGAEEPLAAIEVQMESSSIAAVCGLHHAVLSRMQMLLQSAPEKRATTKIQSLGLREALQRAEVLQNQLSAGGSAGQMKRRLLSVYRELRDNPLLIM